MIRCVSRREGPLFRVFYRLLILNITLVLSSFQWMVQVDEISNVLRAINLQVNTSLAAADEEIISHYRGQ